MVRLWWHAFNNAVFFGKLKPPVKVTFVYMKDAYGWAVPKGDGRISLILSPKYTSRKLFFATLVHEMVHAWDHMNENEMRHGALFKRWTGRIKRTTGLLLERKIRYE